MDNKRIEISHYDKKMASMPEHEQASNLEKNANDYVTRTVGYYFDLKVSEMIIRHPEVLILDYGCGTGQRTLKFSNNVNKLIGVDLSENSIKIAKDISGRMDNGAEFCLMDCEQLATKSNAFDMVIDYGTFSSLHLEKAIDEVIRVLKSSGTLIAVETLGHNPVMNIKRKMNVLLGARTKWAASHILKLDDWHNISKHFVNFEIKYFGLTTPLLALLFKVMPKTIFDILLNKFEYIDTKLLERPKFRKFAFKTVAIMSNPNK